MAIPNPTVYHGLEFLNYLFQKGYSYQQLCMARSAISLFLSTPNAAPFGKSTEIRRFMKGVFEMRPVFPSYRFTWSIDILFRYFQQLPHQTELPLKTLGKKLAILIALLAGGQRCQTIHAINVLHIRVLNDKCIIPIYTPLKQTRPGKHMKPMEFKVYTADSKLCVVDNLKEYLTKTAPIRNTLNCFFHIKSHINQCLLTQFQGGVGTLCVVGELMLIHIPPTLVGLLHLRMLSLKALRSRLLYPPLVGAP